MVNTVLIVTSGFQRSQRAKEILEKNNLRYIIAANPTKIHVPFECCDQICAIVLGDQKLGKKEFEMLSNLKTIARMGTGYDNVDMEEAKKRGVVVTRTAGLNSIAVADLVLGLMIALSRNIVLTQNELVYNNKWFRKPGKMLHELTVGIIGLGHIGQMVAEKLIAAGVKRVIGCNRTLRREIVEKIGKSPQHLLQWQLCAPNYLSIKISEMDVVVVCLALDKKEDKGTQGFISRELLQTMKPDAFLINVGRGATIDEEALYELLEQDKIGGAALDVYSQEPPMKWDLFQKFQVLARMGKNIILTPHMGSIAKSSEEMIAIHAAENIVHVLSCRLEDAEIVNI